MNTLGSTFTHALGNMKDVVSNIGNGVKNAFDTLFDFDDETTIKAVAEPSEIESPQKDANNSAMQQAQVVDTKENNDNLTQAKNMEPAKDNSQIETPKEVNKITKKETPKKISEKIAPMQDAGRPKPYEREDKIQYIVDLYPLALAASEETGLSLDLMLAQAALETGWGAKVIPGSNNMYNIKADPGWHGATTEPVKTHEFLNGKWEIKYDRFRAYDSIEDGVKDRIQFLKENKRYSAVFHEGTKGNFLKEAKVLLDATYATNRRYVKDLADVAKGSTMRAAIERARKRNG